MNNFECFLCISFLTTASQQADDIKLPSGTITCQIDSPERDECLKQFMQDMLSQSVNGMKMFGIPAIDPYVIDSHTVTYKRGGNFSVTATMVDVKVHGASKAKIMDVKTDITKDHITTMSKTYIPESIAEGSYRGEGRYKNFKMKTKGYFNVTATDVNLVSTSEGDIITINGKEYVNFTKFDFTPQFGDVKVFVTGLFPDQDLNRMTIEIVNKYWPIFLNESMPQAQETIEPILIDRANKVSLRVPFHNVLA